MVYTNWCTDDSLNDKSYTIRTHQRCRSILSLRLIWYTQSNVEINAKMTSLIMCNYWNVRGKSVLWLWPDIRTNGLAYGKNVYETVNVPGRRHGQEDKAYSFGKKKAPWERGISVVLSLLSVLPLKVHEDGPPTFPVDLTWNLAY